MIVLDLYSTFGVHERVNHSILRFLKKKYSGKISLFADESVHGLSSRDFSGLKLPFAKSKLLNLFFREVLLPLFVYFICLFSVISRRQIVVLGFSRLQVITCIPVLLFISRFTQVSVLFHSQLELVGEQSSPSVAKSMAASLLRSLLSSKVRKLVLSEHIIESLRHCKIPYSNLYSIPHPFSAMDFVQYRKNSVLSPQDGVILIGAFGLFREDSKRSSKIYTYANSNPNLNFSMVGRAGPGFKWQNVDNVKNIILNKPVSEERARDLCLSFTHMIYPFPLEVYKFTASGSVLDAIVWDKKIICTRTPSLSFFCSAVGGTFIDNDPTSHIAVSRQSSNPSYSQFIASLIPTSRSYLYPDVLLEWVYLK